MKRLLLAITLLAAPFSGLRRSLPRADSPQHLVDSATLSLGRHDGRAPGNPPSNFFKRPVRWSSAPAFSAARFFWR